MNTAQLLNEFKHYQDMVFNLCQQNKGGFRKQFHSDLSPAGWHLGHCIYTESYWIREMFLEDTTCDDTLTQLYNPVFSDKAERGELLPDHQLLCDWAKKTQTENLNLLGKYHNHQDRMGLMQNNFLLYFLMQHYAQHYETMQMSNAQSVLHSYNHLKVKKPLRSTITDRSAVTINAGNSCIGANGFRLPYDNEYPGHQVYVDEFRIATHPVTNAEYLFFMEHDGYEKQDYWTESGWVWRQKNEVICPEYWQQDNNSNWYGINHLGRIELIANRPVYGLSHYEAEAFANWANARLPHEHEWETAFRAGVIKETGKVWEWCSNTFYPYSGFKAYPYDGYSIPFFDGMHYTLKGGSQLTQPVIKRPSFRNYYEAGKRFVFAGLRLIFL